MHTTTLRRSGLVPMAAAAALLLAACVPGDDGDATTSASASSTEEAVYGGTINAALAGDPTTLDSGINSGALTIYVADMIFERLFVLDANKEVQPMLAEGFTLSDDGLTYTITLRDGIVFHDGSTFDSEDAIASLNRWFEVSSTGMQAGANVASIEALDDLTIEIVLTTPQYSFIGKMANRVQAAIMLPAEIIEAAGTDLLTTEQIIGTGPYVLTDYTPSSNITLSRYEDYSSRDDEPNGGAGAKYAYADTVEYSFVADATQRYNGLQTGQWDWVMGISGDDYAAAQENPAITIAPTNSGLTHTVLLNHADSSLFSSVDARQALNMVIDKTAVASSAFGPDWTWSLTPSMVLPSNTAMYSDAGQDVYETYDPEQAAELFAEAGYEAGDTLTILSTETYGIYSAMATVIQAELAEIGIDAQIEIYDFPTMIDRLSTAPDEWDISMTSFTSDITGPGEVLWLGDSWPGSYQSDEMDALLVDYELSTTSEEAKSIVDEIQALVYEEMPVVQVGATTSVGSYSSSLIVENEADVNLWNAWLAD